MRRIFPGGTLQKSIELYAVLGGMPGLWKLLELSASVEENLTTLFLEKNSFLPELMIKWLSEELRETAVYNTILATIADEKNGKLNAMYGPYRILPGEDQCLSEESDGTGAGGKSTARNL